MARDLRARLTPAEGRKFGLTVGSAFLLLSALFAWKGHLSLALLATVPGILLVAAALAVPARLGPVYSAWMGLALLLSRVTTPVFMGAVYFLVMTPIGAARRLFGGNPVVQRDLEGSYWKRRPSGSGRGKLNRQF